MGAGGVKDGGAAAWKPTGDKLPVETWTAVDRLADRRVEDQQGSLSQLWTGVVQGA